MRRTIAFVMAGGVIVAGLGMGFATSATAQDGGGDVVHARSELMKALGGAMKRLKNEFQGGDGYDGDLVKEQARIIRDHAGDALTSKFPEGSLQGKTEALPEIWQDWPRFTGYAQDLESAAEALEASVDNAGDAGGSAGLAAGGREGGMMGGLGSGNRGMADGDALAQMLPPAVFAQIGKVCSGCHRTFRKKD